MKIFFTGTGSALLLITLLAAPLVSFAGGGGGGGGGCSPSDNNSSPTTVTLGSYSFDNSGCTTFCGCTTANCNGTGYSYDICDQAASSGGSASNSDCSASVNMGGLCTISGCFCGSAENTAWAQFCPTVTGPYTFTISSVNCSGGGASLQFGIYAAGAGCGGSMLTCQGGLTGNYSTTQNLTAGQCYTIVFDGNAGAQCSWNFSITTTLPVELISFSGQGNAQQNVLSWITASETANKGFELESSANGRDFKVLGFIPGKGTTSETTTYHFEDKAPVSGSAYYRLKQIDLDGAVTLSDVIRVSNPDLPGLKIRSTVVDQEAVIYWVNNSLPLEATLFNLKGEQVFQNKYTGGRENGSVSVPTHGLMPGIYLLHVKQGSQESVYKVFRP